MVRLAFLTWLVAATPAFTAPGATISSLGERACTTPANSLKNPSFESTPYSKDAP